MADERQGDFLITLASDDDRPRQGTFLDVLFSLAVWLTCLVSGWATYIGFSVDLPKLVAATGVPVMAGSPARATPVVKEWTRWRP